MKILLFSGSLRKDSLNRKLVAVAQKIAAGQVGVETTVADLKSLNFPVYDGDIEAAGIPDSVKQLGAMISGASGLIISSPEYNASIAGSLKNTIDWVSRLRPVPLEKKPILLMGASPGAFGSIRALTTERACFDTLGAFAYPSTFALPKANEAFGTDGDLTDAKTKQKLSALITDYLNYVKKISL